MRARTVVRRFQNGTPLEEKNDERAPQSPHVPSRRRGGECRVGRGRLVGGSNAHFTANFWRLRPNDFNEASVLGGVPGTGLVDWPLTYEELEPY